MKTYIAALLLGGVLTPCALAQTTGTPEFDPLGEHLDLPKQVRIHVEFIEMPHAQLTELMEEPRRGSNDTDLHKKARDLVKQKKARILETAILTTRSGQRAKTESIKEIIYPTEFDPPEVSPGARKEDERGKAGEAAIAPPNPTAFEMRPVGTTVEVDPVIGADGVTVELNIAPEIVYQVGESVFSEWETRDAEAVVSQPHFYSMKITTAVSLIAGQYHLMATVTPQDEEGNPDPERKVVAFVKADILLVGK